MLRYQHWTKTLKHIYHTIIFIQGENHFDSYEILTNTNDNDINSVFKEVKTRQN